MTRYSLIEQVSAITGEIADRFARANKSALYSRLTVMLSHRDGDVHVDLYDMHNLDGVYAATLTNCTRSEYKKLQSSLRAIGIDWFLSENIIAADAITKCNFDVRTRLSVYQQLRATAEDCDA